MPPAAPVVVGFDLDLTLIDTRLGFAATLDVLAAETGVAIDVADVVGRLGPPLDLLLAPYFPADFPADAMDGVVASFRAHYPVHAVAATPALAGAHAALEAVRSAGGRTVVVTGKHTPNARLHLDALGLGVDELVGEVWGSARARCWPSTARACTSATMCTTWRVRTPPGPSASR